MHNRHIQTTVSELRKLLEDLDEKTPILISAPDHSYAPATAYVTTAMLDKKWGWSEDFGELNPKELETSSKRVKVIVIV